MARFIHLKVHSEYSIVDSVLSVPRLLDQAVHLKMPAIALTDEMNLFALIKFYQAALNKGVKPLIGSDLLLEEDQTVFRMTVLCRNFYGFQKYTFR